VKLASLALALGVLVAAAPAVAQPAYKLENEIPLGSPERWDYVVVERETGLVYVAHADKVEVIDGRRDKILGSVVGIGGGTHGTAISLATGRGFTDDGKNGLAIAFDLKTQRILARIPTGPDADAITRDPVTDRIFVVEGDPGVIAVIDPKTEAVVGQVKAGEKLEYAAADGKGFVYVSGEEKSDLLKIDARTLEIVGRFATPACESPHGLAVDAEGHRAFMGCVNGLIMVVDTDSGKLVAELAIGKGSDAVAWDPKRLRVFSSNGGDGTISVYRQISPDEYKQLPSIETQVSGRTMDVDPQTGRLFVAAAAVDPAVKPGVRPKAIPGTLRLLVFVPVPVK
jgi:DNA-binding beta-propeller fold protein YncE